MESKYVYVKTPDGLVEGKAFLDPGVPRSFISESFFRSLGVPGNLVQTTTFKVRGRPMEEHFVWIRIYVDGKGFREKCKILEGLSEDLVLGTPALARCSPEQPGMQLRLKIRPIEKTTL